MEEDRIIDSESPREEITELQRNLMALGYEMPRFGADGDYGGETINAVEAYQSDHGMEITGIADALTLGAIETQVQAAMLVSATYEVQMRLDIVRGARAHIGVEEEGAENYGARIAEYLRSDEYSAASNGDAAPLGSAWCAGFASHVLDEALPNLIDYNVVAKGLMGQFDSQGALHDAGSGYAPQPGDLVFFERGQDGDWRGHVGFIEAIMDDGTIVTIEGNTNHRGFEDEPAVIADDPDSVRRNYYAPGELEENRLLGFGNSFDMYVARNGFENLAEIYASQETQTVAAPVNTANMFPQF